VVEPVTPTIAQVVLDTTNPRASAEFWRQLLGLSYRQGHEPPPFGDDDPQGCDWLNLETATGAPCLAFQFVEQLPRSTWPDSTVPQQLHLDITVGSFDELMSASARVIELGGAVLYDRSNSPEEPLQVYSDPDGHPFCIFVFSGED
jgi:glyoxalase superfamily protein